ncbi:MAG TPA: hypothetical protein VF789_10675 [Thermoanaerobaculia bacterium]
MPGLAGVALLAAGALFFLVLCYLPLQPAALWGDLIYGDWIRQHRALPAADPVLPLADGMPVVDGAWLSQTLLAAAAAAGGAAGLSTLFAVLATATLLLLGRTFHRLTGSRLWAAFGVAAVLALSWNAATVLGPHTFGALGFAALLWLVLGVEEDEPDGRARRWGLGLGVPALFLLWANLHSSFVYGLAVLAGLLLGRLLEAWRSRGLRGLSADRPLRRWLVLGELALAATLINPYGIDLLLREIWLPSSPNLRDLPGWRPLVIAGPGGLAFAASVVLLLAAFRHSRRRVPAGHVLLLAFFGVAAVLRSGLLPWYGPVFAFVALPHLADMVARFGGSPAGPLRRAALAARGRLGFLAGPSRLYSLLALLLVWAAGALSPLGAALLGAAVRPPEQVYAAGTPLALPAYLRANPPRGLVFSPLNWGDWLARQGPPGLRPFAASRVEQLPGRVWRDYLRIAGGEASWPRILDRYRIDTVIFDRVAQREQARTLRYSGEWRAVYEDGLATVFARGAAPPAPPAAAAGLGKGAR